MLATTDIHERAAVLTLVSATENEWYRTAALIHQAGSALRLLAREWESPEEQVKGADLLSRVEDGSLDYYVELIQGYQDRGIDCITVLDDSYPANLRQIYNKPPFLFVRGTLTEADSRSIAVVGTRNASNEGLKRSRQLARGLAERDVTVLSGLALGIDTAAHTETLDAGGRTITVIGTGIERVYPKENASLAERILDAGAVVSQFWPDAPPTRYSFPMRNVVMSGMSVGSVIVEASHTSGARMQARLALDHGKRLFLVRSLVMQEKWARGYAEKPGVVVVDQAEDVLEVIDAGGATAVDDPAADEDLDQGQLGLFT